MNLLTHLWLADQTGTSAAGQILGDMIKGRLNARFDIRTTQGIRLHRTVDSFSDAHPAHVFLRCRFRPPVRRYAGILVDIGFDHALARRWTDYQREKLSAFAQRMERQVCDEWPRQAPIQAARMRGLAQTLAGYSEPAGIQRALDSVSSRLRRRNPLADALPALLEEMPRFEAALPQLLNDLHARARASV